MSFAATRVMPEVPVQIADSLEHLELQSQSGRAPSRGSGYMDNNNYQNDRNHLNSQQQSRNNYSDSYATPPASSQGRESRPMSEEHDSRSSYGASSYHSSVADDYLAGFRSMDEPSFSPFPKLVNPGPNIPPTDEEKGDQIEGARLAVLSSNDPEMQLIWAQDGLSYVEICMNYLTRIAEPPGNRPQTPTVEHQIKADALSVVSFLADQHHPRAEFMRGNWLEFGKFGYRIDKKEAFRCYARAAEKGFARAEYRMGMQYENSNEPMKAIKHYNQGAAMGDSASNYRLGMMTLLGQHSQKQDYTRGVHLIRLAAQTADENAPQGAYVYGMLLARELPGIEIPDLFLPLDIRQAKEMIEKAAFLGFARAQLKMGTAYELCQLGCDFNPALSLHYNALAARQGEPEADMAISKWFLCGHEGVFEKNEELAFKYAQRAASAGLATAEFALGYFYEIGMHVPADLKEAQLWYGKAAAHGNKDASGRIEGISRSKTLSRKDHESVAISKIRARHASQRRVVNPLTQRRQSVVPPIISPVEEAVDMPDPTIPPGNNYSYPTGSPPVQEPLRPSVRPGTMPNVNTSFIAPDLGQSYMDPGNGSLSAVQPPRRPGTTAPYPVRPGSPGSGVPPHARPMSAVGYAMGGQGMIPPAGIYPGGPPRPFTAMDNQGRRPPGGRQQPPYPGPDEYSSPQGRQGPGYPGGFNGESVPHINTPKPSQMHGNQGIKPPGTPIDIGFEAPAPRPKPAKSPAPSTMGGPHNKRISSSSGDKRPGSSLSPHGQQWPVNQQGPPNKGQGSPPLGPTPRSPSPPVNPSQTPKPPPSSATPKPQSTPLPKPPGKGPKTFEEMGVPQQTKDQDCVIM
ncbi:HCP-like protein [Choiromyces venosus 120613-1]|uniref:HCP-like protein n=1 Tax=Choiromyces venosus 120613-1 TaxID=1336337 RepID=A0A3N4JNK4_9PEZI|nr:HCP-like protein [Choiromyces venosus 120613-1]